MSPRILPIEREEPPVVERGAADQRLSLAGRSSTPGTPGMPGEDCGTGNWLVRLSGLGWVTRLTEDSGEVGEPGGKEP